MPNHHEVLSSVHARLRKLLADVDDMIPDMPNQQMERDRILPQEVRGVIKARRLRSRYLDADLFGEPAWDMLLDLYAATLEFKKVSVSSLCIASAVPSTTALRWIGTLTEAGLLEREKDIHDGRRNFVKLTNSAVAAMTAYFLHVDPSDTQEASARFCDG